MKGPGEHRCVGVSCQEDYAASVMQIVPHSLSGHCGGCANIDEAEPPPETPNEHHAEIEQACGDTGLVHQETHQNKQR